MASHFVKRLLIATTTITLAIAASPVEELAQACNVKAEIFNQLLNTSDYSVVDIGELAGLLQQPSEVITSWSAETRQFVLSEFAHEITNSLHELDPDFSLSEREVETDNSGLEKRVDERAQYRAYERQLLSIHNTRVQSANSGCFSHAACGACVVAAGLAGTAGILGCVGTAIEAEILTAVPTFGVATAAIWVALGSCVTRVTGVAVAAFGTCHTLL
ncbi:hypothetical protein EsH8_II_000342 [Colletotrichum jinshuiense]